MITQKNGYGCGLYAVANALDLKDYVNTERLDESKKGVTNFELSTYLQEDGLNLYIDVLYCDTFKSALPKDWTELKLSGDNNCMPILIQCVVNEKYHLVGAKLFQDGKIELMDSLKDGKLKCTLSDVNTMYEKVVGLYSFNHLKNADYVIL